MKDKRQLKGNKEVQVYVLYKKIYIYFFLFASGTTINVYFAYLIEKKAILPLTYL